MRYQRKYIITKEVLSNKLERRKPVSYYVLDFESGRIVTVFIAERKTTINEVKESLRPILEKYEQELAERHEL